MSTPRHNKHPLWREIDRERRLIVDAATDPMAEGRAHGLTTALNLLDKWLSRHIGHEQWIGRPGGPGKEDRS